MKNLTPIITKYQDCILTPIALKIIRSFIITEEDFNTCKKSIYNIFMLDVSNI